MKYRSDVDGLRAIAVLAVIFFHAKLALFSGGFVGVDIFFVISGFLITSILVREISAGKFSLLKFYERRARRLFPALIAMLAVSTGLAYWLFLPGDLEQFSRSLVASSLFSSNVFFWSQTGYFDVAAEVKPLLHTWSLAVEEQFYIFFPLALLAIYQWFHGRWALWLVPVALGSFALGVYGAVHHPSAAFFLAPTRAWELLLGGFLALGLVPAFRANHVWLREIGAVVGLGMIAFAMFSFTSGTPFPGAYAVLPCVGAALIIHAGMSGSTLVGRTLSLAPMVFVGKISYSLYLWHWPIFVFAGYYNIEELSEPQRLILLGVTFVVAVLSWKFIEQPFRKKGRFSISNAQIFAASGTALSAALLFGVFSHLAEGWPQRVNSFANRILNETNIDYSCHAGRGKLILPSEACTRGASISPTYAVWGDSHAAAMIPALTQNAIKHKKSFLELSFSACPPAIGVTREMISDLQAAPDDQCRHYQRAVLKYLIERRDLKTVILTARHALYINSKTVPVAQRAIVRGGPDVPFASSNAGVHRGDEKLRRRALAYSDALRATVQKLLAAEKRVVLIYPVAELGYDVPRALARLSATGRNPSDLKLPISRYNSRSQETFRVLDGLGRDDNIIRIYPHKALCNNAACLTFANGKALYKDDNHLSIEGAKLAASAFKSVFATPALKSPALKPLAPKLVAPKKTAPLASLEIALEQSAGSDN